MVSRDESHRSLVRMVELDFSFQNLETLKWWRSSPLVAYVVVGRCPKKQIKPSGAERLCITVNVIVGTSSVSSKKCVRLDLRVDIIPLDDKVERAVCHQSPKHSFRIEHRPETILHTAYTTTEPVLKMPSEWVPLSCVGVVHGRSDQSKGGMPNSRPCLNDPPPSYAASIVVADCLLADLESAPAKFLLTLLPP